MINKSKSTSTNRQNHSLDDDSHQKSRKGNYRVQTAIKQGEEQLQEQLGEKTLKLRLTDAAFKQQKEVAKALGSSQANIASMAINYVNFYVKKMGVEAVDIPKLEGFPKEEVQRNKTQEISLTIEVEYLLKTVKLQEKPDECVMLGVHLLHKNICQFDSADSQPKQ